MTEKLSITRRSSLALTATAVAAAALPSHSFGQEGGVLRVDLIP